MEYMREFELKSGGVDDEPWEEKAECKGMNSSIFFHPDGERGKARERRVNVAKAICKVCPVLQDCRAYALETEQPYGIWGGMSETERTAYLRRQKAPLSRI